MMGRAGIEFDIPALSYKTVYSETLTEKECI